VLAGMIALVNAVRIEAGKSPLGEYFAALLYFTRLFLYLCCAFGVEIDNSTTFLCALTFVLFLFLLTRVS